jgi:hypothetical protein
MRCAVLAAKAATPEAPQRAVEDEDRAEHEEGKRLVRRIRRHELRQESKEEQRHLRIEHIRQCALPEHPA